MTNWISVPEYAKKYGKSVQYIYQLIKKNKIEHRVVQIEKKEVLDADYRPTTQPEQAN